ncbi:unnamed protein product [Oikopleura dioica]|uniref:Uncharacterized protein n=1 Tax=Oikopleura dioica TaxID=34765 RepID=E4XTQ5_OIKDI|nr:unnamed protein product [Oikopleura dioica]
MAHFGEKQVHLERASKVRQSTTSFETLRRGVDLFRESVSAQISNVSQIVARLDQAGSEDAKDGQIAELGALVASQGQDCQDRFNRLNDKVISNTNSLENFRREIRSWTTKLISIVDDFDKIGKSISDLFELRDVLATRVETNEQQITALQTAGALSSNDRSLAVAADFKEYVTIDQLLQDMADLRHEFKETLSTQLDKLSGDFSELLKDSNEDALKSANQFKSEVERDLQEVKVINSEQIGALTSKFNAKIDSTLKVIETYAKSDGFDDSISDYDESDGAQGQNLGEKIERMEYQIDQLVNEVDDLNGNITNREYLAEVLDSLSSLKTQVDRLDNDGRAQIDGIKLEIDKLIPDVMEPIGKLDSRMKNIRSCSLETQHAYKLFNLTNEFSFDSLKEKIKRIDVRVDDLGSQISKISLGHSVPIFAGASRPGPFDAKDIPIVNFDAKPHSKPAGELSPWSKCSLTCGNGIMTRHMKSDIEKKVCNLGSCSCWGEWGAWSACTKSCGTGITERSRGWFFFLKVYSFSSFDGERFTRRTDLDHNHLKGAMVSVPERGLVMIGGAEGSRRTSSSVEILQNGRWREGPTFPNGGITDSTASVVGGDILIFGGTMESRASDRVYRLAAGSSYWQLMANRLKMPRKQHLSIAIGGSVYLFFGYRETYPIEKWDVIRDESTAIAGETSEMWKNRLFASISLLPGDVCLNLA